MYQLTTKLWIRDEGAIKCTNRMCYEPCVKGFNQCYTHTKRDLEEHKDDPKWIKKYLIQRPFKHFTRRKSSK